MQKRLQKAVLFGDAKTNHNWRIVEGTTDEFLRDANGNPVTWLHNCKREQWGTTAVLCGRGYSATPERIAAAKEAGIYVAWMNNYPRKWQKSGLMPNAWIMSDPPRHFCRRMWRDTDIMKFTPAWCSDIAVPRKDADYPITLVRDCPNVHYYHMTVNAGWRYFLQDATVCWGTVAYGTRDNLRPRGGFRSVMISALRIMWHLGFRRLLLAGCDFVPTDHPDPCYFAELSRYLGELKETCDKNGYEIVQTNPDSHLRVFPIVPFDRAIAATSAASIVGK
jgi:hypothetical protein